MSLYLAVEDELSRAVAGRLIRQYAGSEGEPFPLGRSHSGFGYIRHNLGRYVQLSRMANVVAITDLDQEECAPSLKTRWFEERGIVYPDTTSFVFCVAVREIESWLLSDRVNLSGFLAVSPDRISRDVEGEVPDPKTYIVNLAKKSSDRSVRRELVPAKNSRAPVGMGYNALLGRFANGRWDPENAAEGCPSLQRAIERIRNLNRFPS